MSDESKELQVARALIARGVPVFACPPGDGPKGFRLPVAWQKFEPDEKRLKVWRDGYALAAVMGHAYDVIDWDPRNSPGELPFAMPEVYGVGVTPGRGLHYWIKTVGAHKGVVAPGWDLQSGTEDGGRGFVFLPGTPGYAWVEEPRAPRDGDGSGAVVREHMAAKRAASTGTPLAAGATSLGEPILRGEHQATLFAYACSLRSRGVPDTEAAVLVSTRALDCRPAWAGPDTPWDAVRHAYRYPAGEPTAKLDTAGGFSMPGLVRPVAPGVAVADGPGSFAGGEIEFLDWHALAAAPAPVVDWLVPGIVAAGRGHAIYSPTGLGKSIILLEWAADMAAAGRSVLYVDHENDPHGDVWARLADMGRRPEDLGDLHYASFPAMAPLDSPAGGVELLALAERVGAVVVVIDTASRTVAGEENSNDTWAAWDRSTGVLLRRAGIAFVRLDHAGKAVERGQRGGSGKGTDVDLVWRMELTSEVGAEPVEILLTNEKCRVRVPVDRVAFKRLSDPLRHERAKVPTKVDMNERLLRGIWEDMDSLQREFNPDECPVGKGGNESLGGWLRKFGLKGTNANLAAVCRERWYSAHGFTDALGTFVRPPRPHWAPPVADVDTSGWAVG